MAVTSGTVWRIRPGGLNTNGGGFDPTVTVPGTDYSKQDAAQVTYTDLVIGTPNTTCTSAAHPFGASHVGNVLNITSGTNFTVQRVVITSVSGTTATCNAALGTIGATGGNAKLGGALTLTNSATPSFDAIYGACRPGNTIYILGVAGNAASYPTTSLDYTLGSYGDPTAGDSTTGFVKWIGDPDGPTPTIGTTGLWIHGTSFQWVENLYCVALNNSFATQGIIACFLLFVVKNCIFNLNNKADTVGVVFDTGLVIGCDFYGGTTTPSLSSGCYLLKLTGYAASVVGNYFHYGLSDAIYLDSHSGGLIANNIIYKCAGNGINCANSVTTTEICINNNTVDQNASSGIALTGSKDWIIDSIFNNNVTSNGAYGLSISTGTTALNDANAMIMDYNNYYLNTSGSYLNKSAGSHDLNVNPSYASSTDWTPTNTALGVGYPGLFPGTGSTGHGYIGAVQPTAGAVTNISVSSTSPMMISRTRAVAY